ncbi:MAG TPA: hypothetical protein EYM88_06895 [Gammaproteobacteria bacterium]|nr:hypothetical protein [Gammaproteobacteria bacterium]HIN59822.1 hypothetical protein [Gammaproteobacteria bacterium]
MDFLGECFWRAAGCICRQQYLNRSKPRPLNCSCYCISRWGGVFDYPYVEFQRVVSQLVEKLGSERLMWGTDMPNVERFCNYRQTLDTFRVHCAGVIDDRDLENILGRTAADFFSI